MNINKIKIKKIRKFLLLAVIMQIFLLMNMSIAYSYIIHKLDQDILSEDKYKNTSATILTKTLTTLIKKFFSIKQIGIVSAEGELTWNCCPLTKNGAVCQDLAGFFVNECAVDTQPTKCEQIAECKSGCCVDEKEGLCTPKTTKKQCLDDEGIWKDEENCNIEKCVKGCCVLGSQTQFVTEKRCEQLSLVNGVIKDFKNLQTELECIALSASQFEGACVIKNESCNKETEYGCQKKDGEFFKDYLCSNPDIIDLGVSCEKQNYIGCGNTEKGEYGIYWFDSCGNMENVYNSNKDISWNNGKMLKKENSCNPNSANINSENCGNCDRFLGSVCSASVVGGEKVKDGNYICKDLTCIDENGKKRNNGESWCVYDSYIGDGKDTVGSRHWRRYCIDGEVKVEPCADYRGQICTQSEIEENGKKFSMASCTTNEAVACLSYNSDSDTMLTKCNENKDCMIKHVDVSEFFKFDVCVGRYPRGFDLTGEEKYETSSMLCKMANQECKVIYVKDWKGDWNCEANCECETGKFSQQMNDLCVSLGDCGSYINYIGDGTNNIQVSGAPSVSWVNYKGYANPVKSQYAEPKDLRGMLAAIFGGGIVDPDTGNIDNSKALITLGTISGALGYLTFTYIPYTAGLGLSQAAYSSVVGIGSSFGAAAIGSSIGMIVSSYLAKALGIQGQGALVFTMAGSVGGAVLGYWAIYMNFAPMTTFMIWTLVIVVLFMLYVWLIGWGDTKEVKVTFTCLPWQAPTGGDNCKKCNNDLLKPCTEYRCSSLGQACKLLNEDTENPACISIPYESNPPVITPGIIIDIENISLFEPIRENLDYKFVDKETKSVRIEAKTEDGCITEFTPILFTLETDEYAQCKYNFQQTAVDYKDMEPYYPLEQTMFTLNHTFGFSMPSIDSLSVYDVKGDIRKMFGNMNMYVRCQDYHGNPNIDEYIVNFCITTRPDLTPVKINSYEPSDRTYIKYSQTESPLTIYLSEPAECKYDSQTGLDYDAMSNTMNCVTDVFSSGFYGWTCNTTLTDLTSGENKFYIKCKDQPWLPAENISRNINSEDFPYTVYVSESELSITSIVPNGTIDAGFEPISVDLEAETSGGAKNGEALCSYSFLGYEDDINMIEFFDTYSNKHKQNFNMMIRGEYIIYVKCKDEAGNTATGEINFELIVDSSPPAVARVYKEGGYLKLITDENAECYYDFYTCDFDINNATSMTTALSKSHTAQWKTGKTYHIKCVDIWENKNDGCTIKVSPNYFG